jgi:protein TonB
MEGLYLPRDLAIFNGNRRVLTATVDTIGGLAPSTPELTPSADATASKGPERIAVSAGVSRGNLIKQIQPHYPQDALEMRSKGTVTLRALIGRDGRIHDLSVVSWPSPSLIGAAMRAVSQWEYKPYLLNGEPVEVDTTINVVFNIG